MSWLSNRARRRSDEERLDRLADRVAELAARTDELAAQLVRFAATQADNTIVRQRHTDRIESLQHAIAELAAAGEADREAIGADADRIEAVRDRQTEGDEIIDRLRTDLLRIEGQARIDLAEYRETTAAIVSAALSARHAAPAPRDDAARPD